jgi:hypothetical protein
MKAKKFKFKNGRYRELNHVREVFKTNRQALQSEFLLDLLDSMNHTFLLWLG